MKLMKLHIDRYEHIENCSMELNSPFTIIYGPNEAGKSTVHQFISYMLYGTKRKSRPCGGRMWLSDREAGTLLLERMGDQPAVLHDEQGRVLGEAELKRLLQRVSEQTFRHLYAFSLTELQEVRTLQSDELQAFLFAAGTGVRPASILAAEKQLQSELDGWFRPRGQNQTLNKLAAELDGTAKRIRLLKERSLTYAKLEEQLARSSAEIEHLSQKLLEMMREKEWLELCLKARPNWIRWGELTNQLKQLPGFESFPEQASPRFERLQEQIAEVQSEGRVRRARINQQKLRLEQMVPQEHLLAKRSSLEQLFADAALYPNLRQQHTQLLQEYEAAGGTMAQMLRKIGGSLTEEELMEISITLDEEARLRHLSESEAQLVRTRSDQEWQLQQLKDELQSMTMVNEDREQERKREIRALESKLPAAFSSSGLSEFKTALSGYKSLLGEMKEWSVKTDLIRQQLLDAGYGVTASRSTRAAQSMPSASKSKLISLGWNAVLIAMLAAPFYFAWNQQWQPSFVLSLMWLMLFFSARWNRSNAQNHRRSVSYSPQIEQMIRRDQECQAELKRLRDEISRYHTAFGGASQAAAAAEEAAEGSRSSLPIELKREEQELRKLESLLQLWEACDGKIHRLEQQCEESQLKCRQLQAATTELEKSLASIQLEQEQILRDCREWLQSLHLPETLTAGNALLLLEQIEKAQSAGRHRMQLRDKLDKLEKTMRDYEAKARALLAFEHDDIMAAVYAGKLELQQQLEDQRQRKLLLQKLEEDEQAASDLAEKEAYLAEELRQLYVQAGAEDEDTFRKRIQQYEQQQALLHEKGQIEALLKAWAGDQWEDRFGQVLDGIQEIELQQSIQMLQDQIRAQEQRLNDHRELKGRQALELEQLMNGTELAELELQHASLLAQFEHTAEKWIVHAAALRMIQDTKAVFEKERQPEVMQYASRCFASLTGGRYRSVYSPIGEQRFVVEHSSGARWDPAHLSRGTVEQLYLAIRLAMVREYSKKVQLPIVLDDILVNFDEIRLRHALQVLAAHAEEQQVILFTCHRYIVEAAMETCSGVHVVSFPPS